MCNEAARRIELGLLREDWGQTRIPLTFPEGLPNMAPLDGFKITDSSVIIRGDTAQAELVTRRWSWPGAGGKPVYNFRSDGRTLDKGRCLIPVDQFYEFTAPADPKQKRKDKWAFRLAGHDWFCIAGLWRTDPTVGEAWTMLTCPPGPDVAPYHGRQVVVLGREDWGRWLDPGVPSAELCRPLPAGSLTVARA
ncbi:SOS response-associated peptidase family protein [Sphingomonas sp.]|uniref:SOS response-associated peptidase family protein n=1 Tax=Sphingomonas sp. TaxID=28214 RepID=UPI002D809CA4|nr:SOS response-associated peptidase family protein [Sphingomonas sp.]HEU0045483.1 SOS response-associated peptidase family protein [Sphingomonas sp.]